MKRAVWAAAAGIALAGCGAAADEAAPRMKRVHSIESYDLVCRNDRPTIVAKVWVNSGGWSNPTAIFPGGPPIDGVLPYDAVATPPEGMATQVMTSLDIEVEAVITKGTTHIELRSDTNSISRPHPPGC